MTHLRRLCTAEARYVRRNEVQYVVCMYVWMYAIEEQETVYRWAGTRRMIYRDKHKQCSCPEESGRIATVGGGGG